MLIGVPFVVALVSCSPSFIIGTNFIVLVGSMLLITAKACGEFMLVAVLKLPASLGIGYGSYCRNNRKGGVVKQGDCAFLRTWREGFCFFSLLRLGCCWCYYWHVNYDDDDDDDDDDAADKLHSPTAPAATAAAIAAGASTTSATTPATIILLLP